MVNNSLLLAHVFQGVFWVYLFSCVTSCVVSCGGNITYDMWLQILCLYYIVDARVIFRYIRAQHIKTYVNPNKMGISIFHVFVMCWQVTDEINTWILRNRLKWLLKIAMFN